LVCFEAKGPGRGGREQGHWAPDVFLKFTQTCVLVGHHDAPAWSELEAVSQMCPFLCWTVVLANNYLDLLLVFFYRDITVNTNSAMQTPNTVFLTALGHVVLFKLQEKW